MKESQRILLLSSVFLICGGCWFRNPPRIRPVSELLPATFAFQGHNTLLNVYFEGPFLADANGTVVPHEATNPLHPNLIWLIHGPSKETRLDETPHITYGQLPTDWGQITPENGPPPPLVEGMVYTAGANLDEGLWVGMCVLIRDGKVLEYHGKYDGHDCDEK